MACFKQIMFVYLFYLIGFLKVSSVEITKSIYPSPTFQIDKPPTLEWVIAYNENEQIKSTFLYLDGIKYPIASGLRGYLSKEGKRKLNGTAIITITKEKITVNFLKLEYWYDFNFTCMAAGVPIEGEKDVKYSHIQVTNITGRPSFVGNSELKDQYIIENGTLSFEVKLTGHPCPILTYTFVGKTQEAEKVVIDLKQRIYKYAVKLSDVRPEHCGEVIKFKIIGSETFEKMSFVHVKNSSFIAKDLKYISGEYSNCSLLKIITKCPLNYSVTFYDKDKNVLQGFTNPINVSLGWHIVCNPILSQRGIFATIQTMLTYNSTTMKGGISRFIQINEDEEHQSDTRITLLEIVLIIIMLSLCSGLLVLLTCKCKASFKKRKKTSKNNGSLMTENYDYDDVRIYQPINKDFVNTGDYQELRPQMNTNSKAGQSRDRQNKTRALICDDLNS